MSRLPTRVATVFAAVSAVLLTSCSDLPERLTGPENQRLRQPTVAQDVRAAIAAQERHTSDLMRIRGVVGTAVGLLPNGQAAVQVLVIDNTPRDIPPTVDNIPVQVRVTGMLVALSDPTLRVRPAPVGYSVGHPAITAGTIGARVTNGASVFALSNNHVLANGNDASIGDAALQPGPYDGGTAADQIGTLFAFSPINFSGGDNLIDAAIAVSDAVNLGNSTPTDDGYGTPDGAIFNDANNDRIFDDRAALLDVSVQKYGRTTKLTQGTITGVNATVDICYEVYIIFCLKSARFVDQIIVTPGGFSAGGDSGSLIVTAVGNNPVGLLFAGSSAETIANRIDFVLNYFNVSIDGTTPPPPTPLTDVAVNSVTAPATVTQGATVNVSVVVRNVGNQNVGAFDVTLRDETDAVDIGTQPVGGLTASASATLTFSWNTTSSSLGAHTLAASHNFADENAANNQATTTSHVNAFVPSVDIHVGDLDGFASNDGSSWSATVEITVHNASHAPLNGATVVGSWSPSGLNSDTCTTGDLGGNGTCIVLFPGLRKNTKFVTFTVNSVTMSGRTYQQPQNHDPDGSSNGTTQRVNKP
jgi:CARDB protein